MAIKTKPKTRVYYKDGKPWWIDARTARVQSEPIDYTLPLPYYRENYGHEKRNVIQGSPSAISCDLNGAVAYVKTKVIPNESDYAKAAYNKAYADMWDTGGQIPQSELGVSIAEGREAIKMIIDRSRRLGGAYKALKKGKFKAFLYFLGTRPKKRHANTKWTRPKDAASLWLEYWLGWAPLIGDIYASLEVLVGSAFWQPIKMRGKGSAKFDYTFRTPTWATRAYGSFQETNVTGRISCEIGCELLVTNPNHFLYNQLGLINPYAIAWAVVPFSFIVDWFANIGKFLNGMTDFVGCIPQRPYITRFTRFKGRYEEGTNLNLAPSYWHRQEYTCSGAMMHRTIPNGIPGPYFRIRLPPGLAITQGATAISLLVSIFLEG